MVQFNAGLGRGNETMQYIFDVKTWQMCWLLGKRAQLERLCWFLLLCECLCLGASMQVFLKDNAGLGDDAFVTISPGFTKTHFINIICQNEVHTDSA